MSMIYLKSVSSPVHGTINDASVPMGFLSSAKKAFFSGDNEKFGKLYEEAVLNPNIPKNKMSSQEFISLTIKERVGTGRIYLGFADNMNKYSPYIPEVAPIRMSNLC